MNMGMGDTKELPKDEAALYAQVQALLHQQQQQAVAAQQIQVGILFLSLHTGNDSSLHWSMCASLRICIRLSKMIVLLFNHMTI